uniref:Disease resistance protein n=1 Tax=Caenorhabditis tropicalis TaxID=1561998 RepID=A0A1I7TMM6_9PELO
MTIKGFLNHFGPIQKTFSNSSIQTEEEDKRYGGSRFQLLGLWKIKDTFSSGIPLKLVKEVIEKMKSLSDELEVHQMANYELQHYKGEMRMYLQTVEVNIEKIKKTGECTHLLALPNHPSLSDRFINRYWDCIDEKKKKMKMEKKGKKSSNDPTDSECLFCYFERNRTKRHWNVTIVAKSLI